MTGSIQVALWATEGTVRSQSYAMELHKLAPHLELIQIACPLLVPLVEAGEITGPGPEYFIRKYWDATMATLKSPSPPGKLLLACTHYPLLYPLIRSLLPPEVDILVQGDLVAPSLADYLHRHPEITADLSQSGEERFLTTDFSEGFDRLAQAFLGRPIQSEKVELMANPLPF
jgi:glutamate racemase